MSFFAILAALLIEQVRPLSHGNALHAALRGWAGWVSRNVDAGRPRHGWLAWALAVGVPVALALALHGLLLAAGGWPLAMVWSVAVLYATLGFRQFSHHFTRIRDALEDGEEHRARELLAQWQQVDASALPRSEIVRHVIEYSAVAAHRHVFGVLAWFSLLAACGLGPAGAVGYRMAEFLSRHWREAVLPAVAADAPMPSAAGQRAAQRAWRVIDWLPVRLTALCFAVVGSFEEAIDGWRFHAQRFPDDNDGVVLAATAGAVGVRLGGGALVRAGAASALAEPVPARRLGDVPGPSDARAAPDHSASTPGRAPEVSHLAQIVGLVWRSVVVWMVLLALLTLARLLG